MGHGETRDLKLDEVAIMRRWYRRMYYTRANENCLEKTTLSVKMCAGLGGVVSFYDILFFSKPQTYYGGAARVATFCLPAMGMALAYCSTNCIVSNMRGKEDVWNHTIAGVAAGTVIGAKKMSFKAGSFAGIFLGTLATLFKVAADEDWKVWEDNPPFAKERYGIFQWQNKQLARHNE